MANIVRYVQFSVVTVMKLGSVSRSYPRCRGLRIFVLVVFLHVISAQPLTFREKSKPVPSLPWQSTWPTSSTRSSPMSWQPPKASPANDVAAPAREPTLEKTKTPHPVFFPYVVPIPWPTPFNGTGYAPVPKASHPKLPIIPEPSNRDTYPLLIPVPEFEYVPLYYTPKGSAPYSSANISDSNTFPEPDFNLPVHEELVVHEPPTNEAIAQVDCPPEVQIIQEPYQPISKVPCPPKLSWFQGYRPHQLGFRPLYQIPMYPQGVPQSYSHQTTPLPLFVDLPEPFPKQPHLPPLYKPVEKQLPQQPNKTQVFAPEQDPRKPSPPQFLPSFREPCPPQTNLPKLFTPAQQPNSQQPAPPPFLPSVQEACLQPTNLPKLFTPAQQPSSPQPYPPQRSTFVQKSKSQKPCPPPLIRPVQKPSQYQLLTPAQEPTPQQPCQEPSPQQSNLPELFTPSQEPSDEQPEPTQSPTPIPYPPYQQSYPVEPYTSSKANQPTLSKPRFPPRQSNKPFVPQYPYRTNSHEVPPNTAFQRQPFLCQRCGTLNYGPSTEDIPGRTLVYPQENSYPNPSRSSCLCPSSLQEGQQPAYVTLGPATYGYVSSNPDKNIVSEPSESDPQEPSEPTPYSPPASETESIPSEPIPSESTSGEPTSGEPTSSEPSASEPTPCELSPNSAEPCDESDESDMGYVVYGPETITIYE